MWLVIIGIVVVIATYLYKRNTRNYGMFEKHGIYEPPKYFPFGTVYNWRVMTGRRPFFKALDELYAEYGRKHDYLGTFVNERPCLIVNDLDLARNILIKDFDHFTDRRIFAIDTTSESNKLVANMLTMLTGEKWKKVRSMMSPAFTSGKLKAMAPFIDKVGKELVEHLGGVAKAGEEFSAKEVLTSFTLDCIASCGFGVEANSFKEPNGIFRRMVLQATGGDEGRPKLQLVNLMIAMVFPEVSKALKLEIFDRESMLFFAEVVRKAVAHRRETRTKRGDMIDLVLEALEASEKEPREVEDDQFEKDAQIDSSEYKIERDEIELLLISNAIILFFAGFDTSSSALSMTLAFLSLHPDVQEKLYQEICDARDAQGATAVLDYQVVQALPYLDMVFNETLRFYFTATLERVCSKDYLLPGTSFVVPEGALVQIPSSALHHDARYYPDPDNFNPDENFSEESRAKRSPYAFLSFGQGPRNCMGMRFALLMAKKCLVEIVTNFRLSPGPNMPKEFIMSAATFNGMPKGGVWCKVEKRE